MNPDYCSCNDFEKAVEYNDIHYFRPEDDRFNAIKRQVGIFSIWVTSVLLLIQSLSSAVLGTGGG
jgi:hypothetical protein